MVRPFLAILHRAPARLLQQSLHGGWSEAARLLAPQFAEWNRTAADGHDVRTAAGFSCAVDRECEFFVPNQRTAFRHCYVEGVRESSVARDLQESWYATCCKR